MTPDLHNKIILITGASRGIGRAVALAAAKAGADLIITGRTIGALEELDDEIKATGSKVTIVELDMQDYGAIPRLASAINGRWGRLDGFVANAATLGPLSPLSHLDNSVWNDTIAINLTAQWHLIKYLESRGLIDYSQIDVFSISFIYQTKVKLRQTTSIVMFVHV